MTPMFASYRDHQRLEFKVDAIAKAVGAVLRHEDFILKLETNLMTTAADIKAQSEALLADVKAETNAVAAVTSLVNGLKSQVDDLTQQLKDAIANGADQATLQAIADNLTTATAAVDANAAAEAALTNTAPPAPETAPAPVPPSAAPVLAGISPATGSAAGGDSVTITGTGFAGVTAVTFGGVAAPTVAPDHDTSLTVTTPPGTGTVDVIVTNAGGDSAPLPFTYA